MTRVKRWFSFGSLFSAIIVMFVLSGITWVGTVVAKHSYENFTPVRFWYQYESVVPAEESFASGEELLFVTTVNKRHAIYMQWQDTPYCDDWEHTTWKQPTQYRPSSVAYEYTAIWSVRTTRAYSLPIDPRATDCRMCWVVTWRTPLGYKKIWTYCTDWFKVNQ